MNRRMRPVRRAETWWLGCSDAERQAIFIVAAFVLLALLCGAE
jgi:hypothetical protein